jgi:hypothetical protein
MIVALNGGLGNQMFQYAFGVSVGLARCEELSFHKVGLDNGNHRAYSLGVFNTDVVFKNPVGNPIYAEKTFAFDKGVIDAVGGSYFVGNWQTEKYFAKKIIRAHLTPKNPLSLPTVEWKMKILNKHSGPICSIHVRRTDYLNVQHYHGLKDLTYYYAAMQAIKQAAGPNVLFFVFSDDIQWCRNNFLSGNFEFVDSNGFGDGTNGPSTEHEDLFLMSFCDHAIIPNSSFGWWGAWLGDQFAEEYGMKRIVVAPKHWFNPTGPAKNLDTSDIVPERWIKL